MPPKTILAFVILGVMLLYLLWMAVRACKKKLPATALDAVLFLWTPNDPFTIRDLLNGGVSIIGRAGSGKTSSVGKLLARSIVRHKKSGGLILAAKKAEDLAMWQAIFKAEGREADLIVFSPDMPHRFNFVNYILASGGTARDVTKFFTTIGETIRSADTKAGESSDFWQREQDRLIFNAVVILKHGKVTAPDIQRFITGAATSVAEIATPEWQAGFHRACLKAALDANKTPIEESDFELAADFWLKEFPNMDPKTRSNILTGVMGIMHCMNTGLVRALVSGDTNCSPDDMLAGRWVIVDMSQAEYGDSASIVCGGWKYLTQKRVLRRVATEGDCMTCIWCDEAQQSVTSFDAHFLAQCRSKMGCMVFLTQSLNSYYSTLHGQTGKHQADALLTNFHHKIFMAVGDEQTATYAANLVGKSLQTFIGTSSPPVDNLFEEFMGPSKVTTSTSTHYEQILQSNVFQNGLRCGGKANGFICDGLVLKSGEPFANGQNFLFIPFSQK